MSKVEMSPISQSYLTIALVFPPQKTTHLLSEQQKATIICKPSTATHFIKMKFNLLSIVFTYLTTPSTVLQSHVTECSPSVTILQPPWLSFRPHNVSPSYLTTAFACILSPWLRCLSCTLGIAVSSWPQL